MAVFFLGTNPVAVKLAVLDVPPLPFVAIRFLLAGLLLLPIALLLGQGQGNRAKGPARHGGGGGRGRGNEQRGLYFGGEHDHRLRHRPHLRRRPDLGHPPRLGARAREAHLLERSGGRARLFGVGVVVYGGLGGGGGSSLKGDSLVVIATICWGFYAALSLSLLRTYSPLAVAAYTVLFGGLAALPLAVPGFVVAEWGKVSGGR